MGYFQLLKISGCVFQFPVLF